MPARLLWAVVVGILAGVLVRSFFEIGVSVCLWVALLGVVAFVAARPAAAGRAALLPLAVLLFSFSAGAMRMETALFRSDPLLDNVVGKTVTIEGLVFAEPDARDNTTRLYVRASTLLYQNSTTSVRSGILVAAPAHAGILYGDSIRATGKLELPEAFDTGLGRQFNYPAYLAKDGILYEISFAKASVVEHGQGNPIIAAAIVAKQKFLDGLHLALPEPESGLAGGITVGDKRGPGEELSKDFRTVGLVHIVVLSGYNITLVMNFVRGILQLTPHFVQYGGLTFAVVFFILMSGGAASAVRAGAMALIAVFARATSRVFLATRILGVVATMMVLWNPYTLAFDPSFQLSALATLGLVAFTPFFAEKLTWVPIRFQLREIAASTLATQTTVLPLLLFQNGQIPVYSLPANLLALVAVSPAMFASIGAGLVALVPPFSGLAPFIALPAYALLAYVIGIAQFFSALPFAALAIPAFSVWWLIPVYGLLFFFAYRRSAVETPINEKTL